MLAVNEEQLAFIRGTIERIVPKTKAFAFGSRLTNRFHPYSDIDIALQAERPLPLQTLSRLEEAFSESELPFKVDIVDLRRASEEFRNAVRSTLVPL
jgi:predicted nucleotidyltransferase